MQCSLEKLAYTIQFDEGVERVAGTYADCGEGRRGVFLKWRVLEICWNVFFKSLVSYNVGLRSWRTQDNVGLEPLVQQSRLRDKEKHGSPLSNNL